MAGELTYGEREAYELLFNKHLTAVEASKKLEAKGIAISPIQLRKFKKDLYHKLMTEEKVERMSELMLESVDRIKFEFEDLNKKTKNLLDKAIEKDDSKGQLVILREIKDQIVIGLKYLGEFKTTAASINAKNVNIISSGDIMDSFKRMQASWFSEMGAKMENGKLIFENPSLEVIDDFNNWQAKQLREANLVEINDK